MPIVRKILNNIPRSEFSKACHFKRKTFFSGKGLSPFLKPLLLWTSLLAPNQTFWISLCILQHSSQINTPMGMQSGLFFTIKTSRFV